LIQLSSGAAVFAQRATMIGDEPIPPMDHPADGPVAPAGSLQWPPGRRNYECASDRRGEFLAKAHECLILADRYSGSVSERTFLGAAESWFLLARLEAASDHALPKSVQKG
jgi:hypothetical protein